MAPSLSGTCLKYGGGQYHSGIRLRVRTNPNQTVFWTLQAPVAPGQPRTENGVEADNTSVLKNWRHTMTPAQFGSAQDDGVHAHFLTHLDLQPHTVSHIQGVSAGFSQAEVVRVGLCLTADTPRLLNPYLEGK